MKKILLKSSVAGLILVAFGASHAQQSGRVDFTGSVRAVTCIVSQDSQNQTIDFGIVPPTSTGFTTGAVIGSHATATYTKPVTINLTGCGSPGAGSAPNTQPSTAKVKFSGPINPSGRINTSNSSISIQMLQSNESWDLNQWSQNVRLSPGNNTLAFQSRYYIESTLVAGRADANTTFVMDYD